MGKRRRREEKKQSKKPLVNQTEGTRPTRHKISKREDASANPFTKHTASGAKAQQAGMLFGEQLFEEYYGQQRILPPGEDWNDFLSALSVPLPVTFRLHATAPGAAALAKKLQALRCDEPIVTSNGDKIHYLVKKLPFMGNHVWQLGTSRAGLTSGAKKYKVLSDLQDSSYSPCTSILMFHHQHWPLQDLIKEGCDSGIAARQVSSLIMS